jgi:hypothetical protein
MSMASRPTHDLAVKSGEYQDRNGETRSRWKNIGTMFTRDDGGFAIKIDSLPIGTWDGWISVFGKEDRGGGQAGRQGRAAGRQEDMGGLDDEIPF